MNPCVIEHKREGYGLGGGGVKPDSLIFVDALVPTRCSSKCYLIDEVTRNMLILVGKASLKATAMEPASRY